MDEKYTSDYSEDVLIKDYSQLEKYKGTTYNYKRSRPFKRVLVWNAFVGRIPSDKKVWYINEELKGHRKFALENLQLIPKFSKESRKQRKQTRFKTREELYEQILELVRKNKTRKEVLEELDISYERLKKVIEEFGGTLEAFFKKAEFNDFVVSRLFKGYDLSYIAEKKKVSLEMICVTIRDILGVKDPKKFQRKFKTTIQVLNKQEYSLEEIREIIMEEYYIWTK